MFYPKCPRCGNRLPISDFLIKPKEKRFKIEHVTYKPIIQCGKCMAVVRIIPKVYNLVVAIWIIAGISLLIGTLIGIIKITGFIIIILMLAGCITMLLFWRFIEIADHEKHDQ